MNSYIFLIASMGIYLLQLVAIMAIFYIVAALVLWPIKRLFSSMKQLIRRSEFS